MKIKLWYSKISNNKDKSVDGLRGQLLRWKQLHSGENESKLEDVSEVITVKKHNEHYTFFRFNVV